MALYRNISTNFWTDPKVDDDFTPEDKYFYLYLLTNPHTNICGCYEVGIKQMERETGYNADTISRLLTRLETVHKVIRFDSKTKEVLIVNWSKYNWSNSDKLTKAVIKTAEQQIKSETFKNLIIGLVNNNITNKDIIIYNSNSTDTVTDTVVSIGYQYPIDTVSKPPKTALLALTNEYTENQALRDTIRDFIEMRKKIKAPLTEKALKLCFNKLDGNTDKVKIAMLEQSIERGWRGIFPLKDQQSSSMVEDELVQDENGDWRDRNGDLYV